MFYFSTYPSPIGELTIASDGEHITGLWMDGQKYFGQGHGQLRHEPELPVFRQAEVWLDDYFSGKHPSAACLPLKPEGSPFRRQVWRFLLSIPYGESVTYGQIARMLGKPNSAQAIGGAVGHNPISIVIPCHRVLGAGGAITGYAGGIARKTWLLKHEGILPSEDHDRISPSDL